jgi:hypothetical protein
VTAGGRINASVAADLTNVLLFGVLSIQHLSVHSAAAAASDGAGTSSGDMTLTGVSAQGEALTIDARGIHALGQSQTVPLQSVNQGLAALSSAGVTAAIVPAHQSAVLGRAHYDGEVLQVSETLPDGVVATVDLGSSVIDLFTQPYALAPVPTFQGEAGGVTAAWIPGSPGVPAGHPQPGAPATASTIPGTAQATGLPRLARTAALARVPPALLLGLLSLFEAAMLALVVALLWPAGSTGGGETLSVL